jgi:hypothetical protein
MNAPNDLDGQLQAFLREGPTDLPDLSFDAVRASIEHERQRVVIGPWRLPEMNRYVPIGLGAAAVVAVVAVGAQLLGAAPAFGPGAGASPSVSATPPGAASSPSGSVSGPPFTETFTSERTGITMSYPTGWAARPGTEPWTTSVPDYVSRAGDVVHDPARPEGILWIAVASQPLGEATPEAWSAETIALDDGCTATEPITIDGASGLIGAGTCSRAVVTTDGRGYFIWLYTGGDDPSLGMTYDQAWFKAFLATVQLQP